MRRTGRRPSWTPAEREQVLALADEGVAQRAIAERVFGDARFRGRVERILRERLFRAEPQDSESRVMAADVDAAFDSADLTVARELIARYERALAQSDEVPALADIERLLRIKSRLRSAERLARLQELHRERRGQSRRGHRTAPANA
jgi:hypothetical protein